MKQESTWRVYLRITNANGIFFHVVHAEHIKGNGLTGYKWCFICSSCGYVDGFPFNDRLPQCPCCKATMDLNQSKESEHKPNAE